MEQTSGYYVVRSRIYGTRIAGQVSLATTPGSRRKGLLGIREMKPGAGLWIAPCEAIHTFGMRIPIDVIFLDRCRRVRKLVPRLMPWRVAVCFAANSVLELRAGCIAETGLEMGDVLEFDLAHQEAGCL